MSLKLTLEEFKRRANEIHNGFYRNGMDEVVYVNRKIKVTIICPIHGIFDIAPRHFLNRHHACQKCHKSEGEREIERQLDKRKIRYKTQYTFKNCKGIKNLLPFDFYIPKIKTCIEYDGKGHFEPIRWCGISEKRAEERFIRTQETDKIKTEFCKKNKIKLLRISYKEYDQIEKILKRKIKY